MVNMMNVTQLFKAGSQMLNKNAPAILTAFGAVGVVGTAVLTGKASFEAVQRINDAQFKQNLDQGVQTPLTTQEKVKLVWPLYISAVSSGVLSCGAIVMSHRISSRRAAVLAAAYALNEGKLEEYQDKIKEKFGIKKEKEARDELTQDKVNRDYDDGALIFSPLDGKSLIRDEYSGRFFWSSIEAINKAVNEINMDILMDDSKTLSDFYKTIGLDTVSTSDYFGWNTHDRLEIDWTTCTTPDKSKAVHSFAFVNEPILNPGKNASFH